MKDDDLKNAILSWKNSCPVNNNTTVAEPQPHSQSSSSSNPNKRSSPLKNLKNQPSSFEEEREDAMFSSNTPIKTYVSKDVYNEMHLGIEKVPKIITKHGKLSKIEWQY